MNYNPFSGLNAGQMNENYILLYDYSIYAVS